MNVWKIIYLLALIFWAGTTFCQKTKGFEKNGTMDFDCSEIPCAFTVKGIFKDDITTLKNDDGELFSGYDFEAEKGKIIGYPNPIAYVSSQPNDPKYFSVEAEFSALCETLPSKVGIRGINTEGYNFEPKTVNVFVTQGAGSSFMFVAQSQKELPTNEVGMFDLDIIWQINISGKNNYTDESKWKTITLSVNKVYVTWKTPKVEDIGKGYAHLETVFYMGSKYASGSTLEDNIISNVWDDGFKNGTTQGASGEALHYYLFWYTPFIKTSDLLKNKDGQCYAWMKFFLDVLKAQGVSHQGYKIYLSSKVTQASFLVKNWDFLPYPSFPSGLLDDHPSQEVQNILSLGFEYLATSPDFEDVLNNKIDFTYQELFDDEEEKGGQNQSNPASDFVTHAVAMIDDKIYDPSYGGHEPVAYSEPSFALNYEDENIAGHYISLEVDNVNEYLFGVDLNGSNGMEASASVWFWFVKKHETSHDDLKSIIHSAY